MHSKGVTASVIDLIIDLYHTTINHILPHFVLYYHKYISVMFVCTVYHLLIEFMQHAMRVEEHERCMR